MIDTLLQTKLFIPPTPERVVERPHLLKRLQDGLNGKLTLVAAPAGFGKTTLITSWIDSVGDSARFCWLALDEDDNDLQQFFRYVAAALQPLSESPLLLTPMISPDCVPCATGCAISKPQSVNGLALFSLGKAS